MPHYKLVFSVYFCSIALPFLITAYCICTFTCIYCMILSVMTMEMLCIQYIFTNVEQILLNFSTMLTDVLHRTITSKKQEW
jgi:hypothetical protein